MIFAFLKAYVITVFIEAIIINFLSNRSILVNTIVSITINTITLPFVWFVFPFIIYNKYLCTFISEVFAVFIEGILLSILIFPNWKGIIIAFSANLASFMFGLITFNNYIQ